MELINVISNSTTKELHKRYNSLLCNSVAGNVKDLQQYIFEVNTIVAELENREEKEKSIVRNRKYRVSKKSQEHLENYLNEVIYLNTTDGNRLTSKAKRILNRVQNSLKHGYLTRLQVTDFCNYFLGTKSLRNCNDFLSNGEFLFLKIEERLNQKINQ